MYSTRLKFITISIIFSFCLSFNLFAQLTHSSNQADYIIVTPAQFVDALQPFAHWRQNKDLNVMTVELQQIYAEFPDSTQSASIRDFISYTLSEWSNPKPAYVLLIGDAKLIPSYMVPSMFADYEPHPEDSVSVDEWYSVNLYEADTEPDVRLSRFPVDSELELNNIISKTIYFEDSLSIEDYETNFLFVADKTDSYMFEHEAHQFINNVVPVNFSIDTIFAAQDSIVEISREKMSDALESGPMFLSYYGHGAPRQWSRYTIFHVRDIDSLQLKKRPFILTSAACEQPFDLPADSSIVRKLMTLAGSGTVACINSTGLNYLNQGSHFLTNFYDTLFSNPNITIGDALLQTKIDLLKSAVDAIPRRYTLLGDPALRVPLNTITRVATRYSNIPSFYSLKQNFPNPFNPTTTIRYSIAKAGFVTIIVYDMLGREVATIVNGKKQPGEYEIQFNGGNLSSGLYFYQMRCAAFVEVKKFILMK